MNNLIKKTLFKLRDEKYKLFSLKLSPNIKNMIGVRLPDLREIAKHIALHDWKTYLDNATDDYFEETMLQGIVIGYVKTNIENIIPYWSIFIKKINSWSICDTFCYGLKITQKNLNVVFNFITPYFQSPNEFEVRFAVVMLLRWFNKDEFINKNLTIIDSIQNNQYYVQMAVAWAISTFYVTNPQITLIYLKNNNLNKFTYNKALQKINESFKISTKQKEELKLQLAN